MKICIICVEKTDYAPKRILEEGKKMGHAMYITSWSDVIVDMSEKGVYIGDKKRSFLEFDAIIPRSPNFNIKREGKKLIKRMTPILRLIIEHAKKNKIAILNDKYFTQYQCTDKLTQQFFFFNNNLPGIPTEYFSFLQKTINYPIVVKTAQGSLGSGVFKAENNYELESFLEEANSSGKSFIYQKFFSIKCDYRVLVANNKAIGAMRRESRENEWRTNVSLGGTACRLEGKEAEKLKKLGEKVAKKMAFDYVGVDILEYNKKYYIIEVNSLAQFRGFESAYKDINVAREIIKTMESKVENLRLS